MDLNLNVRMTGALKIIVVITIQIFKLYLLYVYYLPWPNMIAPNHMQLLTTWNVTHATCQKIIFWRVSQVVLVVKNLPAIAGNIRNVSSIPGSGRSLEKGMATHSSSLAWRILWTEEPGVLQSIGLQRVGHDWSNLACMQYFGVIRLNKLYY